MESQPQNPEFRNNPENFHHCMMITVSNRMDDSIEKACCTMTQTPLLVNIPFCNVRQISHRDT